MKSALVIGGAVCVWEDMEQARRIGEYDVLIAINDAGYEYPGPVDFWVTLHPEKLAIWRKRREENGYEPARRCIAHEDNTTVDRLQGVDAETFPYSWPGSSGLFAPEVAIKMLGIDRIVLCGVPMNEDPHFFDAQPWTAVGGFWDAWPKALPHIKDKVRSMSGRTRELLGYPTKEWLLGAE